MAFAAGVTLLVVVAGVTLPPLHDKVDIGAFGRKQDTAAAVRSESEARCLLLQRQSGASGAAIGQSWHSLSVGFRAEWLSRRCNLVLLRALRPAGQTVSGYARPSDFLATSARTSYASATAWGDAEPAASRADADINAAQQQSAKVQCEGMRREHKVRPGVSWGTLSQAQQHTWTSLDCDQFFMDVFGVDKS